MTDQSDVYIRDIDELGYCRIPQVFDGAEMQQALELTRSWHKRSGQSQSSRVPYLNQKTPFVYNLQNKDRYFLELLFDPQIEAILVHFLNDEWFRQIPKGEPNYILRSYLARSSDIPLPLHIDSFIPYLGSHVSIMQVVIVLENMNEENGSTLVVPGTHKSGSFVNQDRLKDAIPLAAQGGDVVLWDSRLWHAAGENTSGKTRWALIGTFARWWIKQAFNIPDALPPAIYDQLTPKEKAILGYCSVPWLTEEEGIDSKRGYEDLADRRTGVC